MVRLEGTSAGKSPPSPRTARFALLACALLGCWVGAALLDADHGRSSRSPGPTAGLVLESSDVPSGYHRVAALSGPITPGVLADAAYAPWRARLRQAGWVAGYAVTYQEGSRWRDSVPAVIGSKVMVFRTAAGARMLADAVLSPHAERARPVPCRAPDLGDDSRCWSATALVSGPNPHDRYVFSFRLVRFAYCNATGLIILMSSRGFDPSPSTAQATRYARIVRDHLASSAAICCPHCR